jgi:diadenosine tetraphosphate (Ap4A) HIT family hydrolase
LQEDGSLTSESRARIETFVSATFVQRLAREVHADAPEDRVLWFKNWAALQSVSALEHFHVMVRDASEQALSEWIGADNMVTICDVSK